MADFTSLNGYDVKDKVAREKINILEPSTIDMYFPYANIGGDMSVLSMKKNDETVNCIIDFYNTDTDVYDNIKSKLVQKGITKFNYAFVSHYHQDHVGNLISMINDSTFDFSDCVFYLPPTPDYSEFVGSARYIPTKENEIINVLTNKGIDIIHPTNNTNLSIFNDINIKFFNCDTDDFENYYNVTEHYQDVDMDVTIYNNFSMVLEITHGNERLLFTGDLQKEGQDVIISQGIQVPTFIKVEHHGVNSITQYSDNYIKNYWKPKIAVMLENENNISYIGRMCKKYELYHTYNNGDIEVISTGNSLLAFSQIGSYDNDYTEETFNTMLGITSYINLDNTLSIHYIKENDNLNDYINPGTYLSRWWDISATLSNAPTTTSAFKLVVMKTTNYPHYIQYAFINNSSVIMYRHGDGESVDNLTWSNWYKFDSLGDNEVLATGTDLNDLSIGNYTSSAGEITTTLVNAPSDIGNIGFYLECRYLTNRTDRLIQTIVCNSIHNTVYIRVKDSTGSYGEWSRIDTYKNKLISNGTDLDNLKVGRYTSINTSVTTTLLNVPSEVTGAFFLDCIYMTDNIETRKIQKIIPNTNVPTVYYRTLTGGGWSAWYKFQGTQLT